MLDCATFLQRARGRRVLDLGSGFGRWSNFLASEIDAAVVGIDSAVGGCALGARWRPEQARAVFTVGDVTRLPFTDQSFDAFLAVLIIDNMEKPEGQATLRELDRVLCPGALGFVVLNPWPMPPSADDSSNPTRTCRRHDFDDQEALELMASWQILSWERAEHGFRSFRVKTGAATPGTLGQR
ncbi:MAG: class I SAM-dependent methyltransferase [Acidobacteriota bacterium]